MRAPSRGGAGEALTCAGQSIGRTQDGERAGEEVRQRRARVRRAHRSDPGLILRRWRGKRGRGLADKPARHADGALVGARKALLQREPAAQELFGRADAMRTMGARPIGKAMAEACALARGKPEVCVQHRFGVIQQAVDDAAILLFEDGVGMEGVRIEEAGCDLGEAACGAGAEAFGQRQAQEPGEEEGDAGQEGQSAQGLSHAR